MSDDVTTPRKRVETLIPPGLYPLLRRAFTVRGLEIFDFYTTLYAIRHGGEIPANLRTLYKRIVDRLGQIKSPVDKQTLSPMAVNAIALCRESMNRFLLQIEQGKVEDSVLWTRINNTFVPLLVEIARDKGIYMKPQYLSGRERWAQFRKLSEKQEKNERLKDEDPESYALLDKMGKTLDEIDRNIRDSIVQSGLEPKKSFMAGRPVLLGVDTTTGEERIYDRDGDVLTREEFFEKVRAKDYAKSHLRRVPDRVSVNPKELRLLTDEDLKQLDSELTWDAITDDKAKQGRLTRIFPTKTTEKFIYHPSTKDLRIEEYKVVVEGRYKGIYLDDLINSEGRLVEGTSYQFDPKKGTTSVPKRMDQSEREPYVTVAEVKHTFTYRGEQITQQQKKLYVKIDGTKGSAVLRNALKALSCNAGAKTGCVPSIVYDAIEGSRAAGFYFEPKDFGLVMQTLNGMSLSTAALDLVKGYYKELQYADKATQNLEAYSAQALSSVDDSGKRAQFVTGGFEPHTGNWKPFQLHTKQQESLAWLGAQGDSGVCALGTGMGKSLVGVGVMMKLLRDGHAEKDAFYLAPSGEKIKTNGRFLFVAPTSLRGNIRKEIRDKISDPTVLLDRLDVITYPQFTSAVKTGAVPRQIRSIPFWKERAETVSERPWDPSFYVSIIFDEAQTLKNPATAVSAAALKTYHPRKVCLTASPMERNPMEAYVLAAVCKNKPLFGKSLEASQNREEMRRFKERYCEVVGGRIVGLKQESLTQRDLHTWVKQNVYFADKTEASEYTLKPVTNLVMPVEMDPVIEEAYRSVTEKFSVILQGAARKFSERTRGDAYADRQAERVFSMALSPVIRLLTDLGNRPAEALRQMAIAVETGTLYGDKTIKPIQQLIVTWQERFSPEYLRAFADHVGNPKIEAAQDLIRGRVDGGSRSLLFTEDRELAKQTAMEISRNVGGTHVAALNDEIWFYQGGRALKEWVVPIDETVLAKLYKTPEERAEVLAKTGGVGVHALPFTKRALRLYPGLPGKQGVHQAYQVDDWQQFVLRDVVNATTQCKSCTLLGRIYMFGHNLQGFDTVIHLDRDSWNSESMKQRTARAWRQGQEKDVEEITIDSTFGDTEEGISRSDFDQTLDEIRRAFQSMDADLFTRIIRDAQKLHLGKEWEDLSKKDASLWRLDEKVLELQSSPYLTRAHVPGAKK